jgi:hypothetical protein
MAFSFAVKRIYRLQLGKPVINVEADSHVQPRNLLMWTEHVRKGTLTLSSGVVRGCVTYREWTINYKPLSTKQTLAI